MSVIAWDGKIIAADRMCCGNGIALTTTKIVRFNNEVIAAAGSQDQFAALLYWYKNGAFLDKWPRFQEEEDNWTQLIVASKESVWVYGRYPYKFTHTDKIQAFGAGRELALGAMSMGANAIEAVRVACKFETSCGRGIDAYEFRDDEIVFTTFREGE